MPTEKDLKKIDDKSHDIQTIITWNSGANLSNNKLLTDFLKFGSFASLENTAKIVITKSGQIKNLTVKLVNSIDGSNCHPGAGKNRLFTIRKNGVNTPLVVKIDGSNTHGSNNSDIIKVEKFDLISLAHNTNNYPDHNAIAIVSVELL